MNSTALSAGLAISAVAIIAAAAPVLAQTTVKEVTVEAPRTVTTKSLSGIPPGTTVKVTTVKVRVNYTDLDLTRMDGFQTLRARVTAAASSACAELDRLYPNEPDPQCLKHTILVANGQAEDASAAAFVRTLP